MVKKLSSKRSLKKENAIGYHLKKRGRKIITITVILDYLLYSSYAYRIWFFPLLKQGSFQWFQSIKLKSLRSKFNSFLSIYMYLQFFKNFEIFLLLFVAHFFFLRINCIKQKLIILQYQIYYVPILNDLQLVTEIIWKLYRIRLKGTRIT